MFVFSQKKIIITFDTNAKVIMKKNIIVRIGNFYYEGFRQMTIGRTLWLIILIKLFIIFAVLRLFFFQPALQGSDSEKAKQVRENLMAPP